MSNLHATSSLSSKGANIFSIKAPNTFTDFISDLSHLPDEQQLECVHVMSAIVNREDTVPQTSFSAMTVCAPYIVIVNNVLDKNAALSEKRRLAGQRGGRPRKTPPEDADEKQTGDFDFGEKQKKQKKQNGAFAFQNVTNSEESDSCDIHNLLFENPSYKNKTNKTSNTDKTIGEISKKKQTDGGSNSSNTSTKSNFFQSHSTSNNQTTRCVPSGVTWERHEDASIEEVLSVIPCPGDYDHWFAPAMGAARSSSWSVFSSWCRTGENYDEEGCRRFYIAANRTKDRPNAITEKVLYRIYNYGPDCIRPLGEPIIKGFQKELDNVSDADIEEMKRREQNGETIDGENVKSFAEKPSDAIPKSTRVSAPQMGNHASQPPFEMLSEKELEIPEEDIIRPNVVPAPLPPLSGKRYFHSVGEYLTDERGISGETVRKSGAYVSNNYLRMPIRDWQGNNVTYTDANGKKQKYEVIRNLAFQPNEKGPRYIMPGGVEKQPYEVQNFFNGSKTVFMTEGEIDTLSVMDVGCACVGDHDKESFNVLDDHLDNATVQNVIIIADDDATGYRKARRKYLECKKRGLSAKVAFMPHGCHDANDFNRMNRDAFIKFILDIAFDDKQE